VGETVTTPDHLDPTGDQRRAGRGRNEVGLHPTLFDEPTSSLGETYYPARHPQEWPAHTDGTMPPDLGR
jgi:hypothetical protein